MRLLRSNLMLAFFLAAILLVPAWADNTSANRAVPGTINYVEGTVSIGSETLDAKSIGSADLQANQSLTTQNGKAEILLTPGVFLRVGSNSDVQMISPSLIDTHVALAKGHAMIEVNDIHPQNDIRITANGATATLLKTGLYDIDLNQNQFRVFDGEADVIDQNEKQVKVKAGHEVALAPDSSLKTQKFDKKSFQDDDLYKWSSLRSSYTAEANVSAGGYYAYNGWGPWGPGWWGGGWYWNPWFGAYTFLPADGIFWSPFGWGYYSPWLAYRAPFYGYYGFGPGYRPVYYHFTPNPAEWGPGNHYVTTPHYTGGIYHGPGSVPGGGFHSGPQPMSAPRGEFGGYHGGFEGGGFHGGGFHGGVGFHGGGGFSPR
jgi:hypothetical protein